MTKPRKRKPPVHKLIFYVAMGDRWTVNLCLNLPSGKMANAWKNVTCKNCLRSKRSGGGK